MNIKRKGSFWFAVLLLAFPLFIILTRCQYSDKARLVPLLVGMATLILGILVLIGETYPRLGRILEQGLFDADKRVSKTEPGLAKGNGSSSVKRILTGFGLMVGFFMLVWLVGFLLAIPVFVLCFLKIIARLLWIKTLLITLFVWGFVVVVFCYGMRLELFKGILWGGIATPFW